MLLFPYTWGVQTSSKCQWLIAWTFSLKAPLRLEISWSSYARIIFPCWWFISKCLTYMGHCLEIFCFYLFIYFFQYIYIKEEYNFSRDGVMVFFTILHCLPCDNVEHKENKNLDTRFFWKCMVTCLLKQWEQFTFRL